MCFLSGLRLGPKQRKVTDQRIPDTHSYQEKDPLAGLEVVNDKPINKPQPISTRDYFLSSKHDIPVKYREKYEKFRYPVVALDPALEPPDLTAWQRHHSAPEEHFPSSPAEANLSMYEYLKYRDCWLRKKNIIIPYFTVGSVIAVTASDPNQPKGFLRFVGMCLQLRHKGLGTNFRVANVIDSLPVCRHYELYGPYIQKIEVIKLRQKLPDMLFMFKKLDPIHYKVAEDMPVEDPTRDPYDLTPPPRIPAVKWGFRKKHNLS